MVSTEELLSRREHLLGVGARLFYDEPLHIVRGKGVWLFDAEGNRYLDLYNNVPCVGHANPHVIEAMSRQASTLNVHSRYLDERILDYAERLTELHADPLTTAVFTCTGTEANEVALMMARAVTGGQGIVATNATYHGNSSELRQIAGTRHRAARGSPLEPWVRSIPVPQLYRPVVEGGHESELCDIYLAELKAQIDGFRGDGIPFAGMIACPIFANEGLPNVPSGFLERAAQLVHESGGVFICDEVQAGFGRTGRWWGYQTMDFVPDIVTMGKPMGNGFPLAGAIASAELVNTFRRSTHYFNTFASSPLQAAVGMAVLDVIEDQSLIAAAGRVGAYLSEQLRSFQDECPEMGDVRGNGLFIGIDWVSDHDAKTPDAAGAEALVNEMKRRGMLIGRAGEHGNVLKVRPPLVFEKEHAELFLDTFHDALGSLHATGVSD